MAEKDRELLFSSHSVSEMRAYLARSSLMRRIYATANSDDGDSIFIISLLIVRKCIHILIDISIYLYL